MSDETAKFCAQCGAPLGTAARFCAGCGTAVGGVTAVPPAPRSWREQLPGISILASFLVVGLVLWIGVLQDIGPAATAPRPPGPPPGAAPGAGGMPSDHPPVGLTDEAKQFLEQLTEKAEAAPSDPAAWTNLAQVQARAAQLDPTYAARAVESYRHVLNLRPDDPDAIRAMANVLYDQKQYAEASAEYERYLEIRPGDVNVRTDLATTYLYRQEIDRAIAAYESIIADDPDFLQAHFNLGLAHEARGEHEKALAAIAQARKLAKDDATRTRIDKVVAELEKRAGSGAAAPAGAPPATAPADAAPAAAPAGDYRAAVEQRLRAHNVLGPKITGFEWTDDTRVRVVVRQFPMNQMPDSVRNLFRGRLETIIFDSKEQFDIEGERTIELVDEASGTVMDSATQ